MQVYFFDLPYVGVVCLVSMPFCLWWTTWGVG